MSNEYSDSYIYKLYKNAENTSKQIGILCQLTNKSRAEITDIIEDQRKLKAKRLAKIKNSVVNSTECKQKEAAAILDDKTRIKVFELMFDAQSNDAVIKSTLMSDAIKQHQIVTKCRTVLIQTTKQFKEYREFLSATVGTRNRKYPYQVILDLIFNGLTNIEITEILDISESDKRSAINQIRKLRTSVRDFYLANPLIRDTILAQCIQLDLDTVVDIEMKHQADMIQVKSDIVTEQLDEIKCELSTQELDLHSTQEALAGIENRVSDIEKILSDCTSMLASLYEMLNNEKQ